MLVIAIMLSLILPSPVQDKKVKSMAYPKGITLNNPGLIRLTDAEWIGKSKFQKDKDFVRFDTPLHGVRAIMKVLTAYQNKHHINTIGDIITRWAPPNENNTEAYIREVSRRTGFYPDELLDMSNIDTLVKLAKAIVLHENGHPYQPDIPTNWYTEAVYHAAGMMVINGE